MRVGMRTAAIDGQFSEKFVVGDAVADTLDVVLGADELCGCLIPADPILGLAAIVAVILESWEGAGVPCDESLLHLLDGIAFVASSECHIVLQCRGRGWCCWVLCKVSDTVEVEHACIPMGLAGHRTVSRDAIEVKPRLAREPPR
jgi:hypothetical protein